MMDAAFYTSPEWRAVADQARARDGNRCTVARLLGGACLGVLHGHHIDRDADPLDIDNVGTTCASHHPRWEALRRALARGRRQAMSGEDAARARAVRAARRLVRNTAGHIDTETDLIDTLYGWGGYLRGYQHDETLRQRMVDLWRTHRAAAQQLVLAAA